MGRKDSDIIEIRLYDNSYQLYFKQDAKIKDYKKIKELFKMLENKGIKVSNFIFDDDWL